MPPSPPETPVLDRRKAVLDESHAIGAFLDWLSEQGIHLARWVCHEDAIYPYDTLELNGEGPSSLLHRYFDIDPAAEEAELRALLEYQRALNEEYARARP